MEDAMECPISDNDDVNWKLPALFANHLHECENIKQLIQFYHATMASPEISTWCKAIDSGYFQGWPSLTYKRVREHIKVVYETEMGHMDQRDQQDQNLNNIQDQHLSRKW